MKPSEFAARLGRNIESKADVRRILNQNVLNEIGQTILEEMQASIEQGSSPIKGRGKFPRYKNPDKYPGDRKPHRPVNLYLTGQMLSSLRYSINKAKVAVRIFYANRKAQLKELGHREGANGQPSRPTIPNDDEALNQTISKRVQELINQAVRQASLTWK